MTALPRGTVFSVAASKKKRKKKKPKAAPKQKRKQAKKGWYPERWLARERGLTLDLAEKWIAHQGGSRSASDPGVTHQSLADIADVVYGEGGLSYEEMVDAFIRAGSSPDYVPTMGDYRFELGNLALGAHRYVRWANFGMPMYMLDPGTATMLALTDVSRLRVADVRFPFPTFIVVLEPGAPLYVDVDGKARQVRYIWVHHHEDRSGRMVLHVSAATSDGVAVQMPFIYGANTTVGEWLDPATRRQDYGPGMTPLDGATIDRAVQLVVSLAMHLATTRAHPREPRHQSQSARIGAAGLPDPKDWIVARVTMPKEIGEAIRRGGASLDRALTVRHVVRGHWRMQPFGPGRSQYRPTWIAPHWRGEGPEALTKTIVPGNPDESVDEVKARLTAW